MNISLCFQQISFVRLSLVLQIKSSHNFETFHWIVSSDILLMLRCFFDFSFSYWFCYALTGNASCSTINCNRNRKCLTDVLNNNEPRCVTCPMPCPRHLSINKNLDNNKLICASNNVTYLNWCSMMNEACSSGTYLHAVSSGPCNPNEGKSEAKAS